MQVIILNTPLPPVFGFEIVKDGILLIDRESNLRMEFENRILGQYHDWQYFLKRQMEAEQKNVPRLSHKKRSSSPPQRRFDRLRMLDPGSPIIDDLAPTYFLISLF